ncbi:hypothetical protein [Paenibacillus sp. FSL W7-1332]|uniref:hypothetical protein n=1 Tax=Paenibacillus sp. FSL W7-1332 TaxID=2921702 RepID=UPI0030CDAEF5
MAEVQFNKGEETVNFLISKGGENGIGTTGEVKKRSNQGNHGLLRKWDCGLGEEWLYGRAVCTGRF